MTNNLQHKLIIPTVFGYIFFAFVVISTVVNITLSNQYFDNSIVIVINFCNLSLSSIFLALMAKQKWKYNVSQTSHLWLFMIGIKLISIPLFSIVFSQYFLNSLANLICGIIFTKVLLNGKYLVKLLLSSVSLTFIASILVQFFISIDEQVEYGDFLSNTLIELFSCIMQLLAVLFLTFYKKIENEIKIDTIKNFSTVMAHEVFTPIAVMETQIGMLKNHGADQDFQKVLKLLTHHCRKIRKRINFVIDNTKNINVRPIFIQVHTPVKQVLQDCIDDYKSDNIQITLIAHNNINFPGPKNMLESVFYNIIDNAFQHSGNSPNIEIIISEDYVIFQDSGCGIKQGSTNHIFDIFTSSKEHHLGIGLTVCKDIINNYGGSIRCISLEGHHTTFIIKFPKQCSVLVAETI